MSSLLSSDLPQEDYINEDHIEAFAHALAFTDPEDSDLLFTPSTDRLSVKPEETAKNGAKDFHEETNDSESAKNNELLLNSTNLSPGMAKVSPDKANFSEKAPTPESGASDKSAKTALKISSKSDWFPSSIDTKKEPRPSSNIFSNEFRKSSSYMFFRWPILAFILGWISFLCFIYTIIRAYVALSEYFFTWTGERKKLRDKLRSSANYEEWVQNAIALDKFLGLDKWSDNPKFSYYDPQTITKTMKMLKLLRKKGQVHDLMVVLQGCLKSNFAGIENRQLYSHRYYGTKTLVTQYIEEVVKSIRCVSDASEDVVSMKQKRKFFKVVQKNYGKTALCLSGGACFAYTHFGIVKALLENDLLPKIISGTSGGGLIAALTCSRTDEELKQLLVPALASKITACEDPWYVWLPRWWKTGARFDAVSWARKANFFTRGSLTFQEAFNRTGRKLNISTVPAEPHSPVILCNSITSPNCIIWSSLLASSAVPGILNPVVLMMKNTSTGEASPFSMGVKWKDGSLRTDIPVDALNTYYNVTFSVVSQVNPHISLFFYAPKGTVGKPVAIPRRKTQKQKFASLRGGFFATATEHLLKLEIKKWLQIVKLLDLFPNWSAQDWSNVFLQRFTGTLTIWPRNRFKDFLYILSDPNEARMEEYLQKGERSMYPRLLFLKHRLSIERAIEDGRDLCKGPTSGKSKSDIFGSPSSMASDDNARMDLGLSDPISNAPDDNTSDSSDMDYSESFSTGKTDFDSAEENVEEAEKIEEQADEEEEKE